MLQDVADNLDTIRPLVKWHEQESILRVDANRRARVETPAGKLLQSLGMLHEVSPSDAERCEAWTKYNGRYWVAA